MKTEIVASLIARYGIPAALQIVQILSTGDTFTPEMEQRLVDLGAHDSADYKAGPVA